MVLVFWPLVSVDTFSSALGHPIYVSRRKFELWIFIHVLSSLGLWFSILAPLVKAGGCRPLLADCNIWRLLLAYGSLCTTYVRVHFCRCPLLKIMLRFMTVCFPPASPRARPNSSSFFQRELAVWASISKAPTHAFCTTATGTPR